ncbi:replication protein [Pantoea sp.]|uniref:replication protein n=1 Tax=Pantoea sp. TaxID=69393 RepID=UPI0029135CA1|nr:replication protein [Pantoea sp.]MDU5476187.1 replication protein [Pantoea sp.]
MSNVAYATFGALKQPVERRVVDIDDGYTKVANELLEAIASADLTARQLKIMLAYMRKTYGFNKKSDRIADEQIASITGISRQNVNKAKKELLEMNCLFREGSQIGINKEVSAWRFSKSLQVSNLVSKPETNKVSKLETSEVSNLETHKRHSLKKKENTQTRDAGLSGDKKLTPRQAGTNPRALGTNPRASLPSFDRELFVQNWNRKADVFGLPKIKGISTTTENGIKRLWKSYLKHCKETGNQPANPDAFFSGYITHGYKPSKWACGENPDGKRYGIDTALTQKKIDEIISQEV